MRPLGQLGLLLCLLGASSAGCGDDDHGNQNDAGQAGNHRLLILTPPGMSIGLAPNEPVTLRVQYLDAQDRPVADGLVSFTIMGSGGGASLGGFDALSDASGTAEMLLLAGGEDAYFTVEVTAEDALPVSFEVAVSEAGFSALEVLPTYRGGHPSHTFTSVRAQVYFDSLCEDRPVVDPAPPDRQRFEVAFGNVMVFENLPADRDYAVVLRGLDTHGTLLAWACAEVSRDQLIPGVTVRLYATAVDVTMRTQGTYTVTSEVRLPASAAPAVTAALEPARQLASCSLGPEQPLLDCLLDAWFPDGAADCDPQTTDPTALALQDLRGLLDTDDCRDPRTALGDPGLESLLRQSADATGLARFEALAALAALDPEAFTRLQVRGELTFVESTAESSIYAWHRLDSVCFPDVVDDEWGTLSLQGNHPLEAISLPCGLQTGAPLRLTLPPHDLALHPAWSAWTLARTWWLAPVGLPADPAAFLARLVETYHGTSGGNPVSGCAAVEARLCQALGQPDPCLAGACAAGLALLEQRWLDAWSLLASPDTPDVRFTTNVALRDDNGDLVADGLGTDDLPGTWLLTVELGGQSISPTSATFSATRLGAN